MWYSDRVALFPVAPIRPVVVEDKRAAILKHRPAATITANHKVVSVVADDVKHRPRLDDQGTLAIG